MVRKLPTLSAAQEVVVQATRPTRADHDVVQACHTVRKPHLAHNGEARRHVETKANRCEQPHGAVTVIERARRSLPGQFQLIPAILPLMEEEKATGDS